MSKLPRLTYFDLKGRGEPIRLALYLGGIQFEDNRVSRDEWQKLKPSFGGAQLPILEMDGLTMTQSMPILRYIGRLVGLYPSNDVDAALVDENIDVWLDIIAKIVPSLRETDATKRMEMRRVLAEEDLPNALKALEQRFPSEGKFIVGDKMTVGDINAYVNLSWFSLGVLDGIPTTLVNAYPKLKAFQERMARDPKILEWNLTHLKKPKLIYFAGRGRAEAARLCFYIGGIDFEDVRIPFTEWQTRKESLYLPYGQLPVLQVDDIRIAQSIAIARYAAKQAGLYSSDPMEAYKIDEILGMLGDTFDEAVPLIRALMMKKPADEIAACRASLEKNFTTWFPKLEAKLTGDYFVGNKLTLADISAYVFLSGLGGDGSNPIVGLGLSNALDSYPKLKALVARVGSNDKVREFNEKVNIPAGLLPK